MSLGKSVSDLRYNLPTFKQFLVPIVLQRVDILC